MFVKTLFIAFVFICSANISALAGLKSYHDKIYQSYISNDISIWENTLTDLISLYNNQADHVLLYEITLSHYGIIGYHLDYGSEEKASNYLSKAQDYLEELLTISSYKAQSLAFKSAFYGFEISLNSLKGLTLGRRSHNAANEAVEADEDYPRVWVEKGNVNFYTPAIVGGSKEEAIKYYEKAIKMFEHSMQYNHRWLYLNTLVMLARAYEETGNDAMAIQTVRKALMFEPGFILAKEDYLPKLLNK